MNAKELAAKLRSMADIVENIDDGGCQATVSPAYIWAYTLEDFLRVAEEVGGVREDTAEFLNSNVWDGTDFLCQVTMSKHAGCKRVQVGTEEVEEEMPIATEKRIVQKPIMGWVCEGDEGFDPKVVAA